MEIIAIEKRTFEQMMQSFESFVGQVKKLCQNRQNKNEWLNNDEVCKLLKISKRTLQACRDNGIIPFSQIGHKCYYRVVDIEQFISNQQNKK
ncbi:DNA-binding protein [Bacteroidia bacterium]|nr:DNA-binding protein [Bacteroidia bacterium]